MASFQNDTFLMALFSIDWPISVRVPGIEFLYNFDPVPGDEPVIEFYIQIENC